MIYLYTGANGSGKTANILAQLMTDKQFQNRDVYFFNVHGLDVAECSKRQGGFWREIDDEGVRNWQQLPQGSILLVDEAHKVMPSRQARIQCPEWIVRFDEHRHDGLDLILGTQHPKKLDVEIRRLVSQHIHLVRTSLNCSRFLVPQCVDEIDDPKARRGVECTKSKVQLPKFVFSLYKSAEVHTHKYELPAKARNAAILAVVCLLGIGFAVNAMSSRFDDFGDSVVPDPNPVSSSVAPPQFLPQVGSTFGDSQTDDYSASFKPRKPLDYRSAPIYDEVNEVVEVVPIPHCIINTSRDVCNCYSQQMTLMREVSQNECKDIVNYGRFNPAQPSSPHTQTAQGASASAPRGEGEIIPLEVYEDMYRNQYSSARWVVSE